MKHTRTEVVTATGRAWVVDCSGGAGHLRKSAEEAKAECAKLGVLCEDKAELTEENVEALWAPVLSKRENA